MSEAENLEMFDDHLHYEVAMMHNAYHLLQGPAPDQFTRNCWLEVFTLHARCLMGFLSNEQRAVSPWIYAPDYRTPTFKNDIGERFQDQLVTLSWGRTSNADEKINNQAITDSVYRELKDELYRFQEALAPEYRERWRFTLPPPIDQPSS